MSTHETITHRLTLPVAFSTAFLCGGAVLMLEILGSRLMAPIYGTGLEVWAALISVTLIALSAGYWIGGVLADRWHGNPARLPWILVTATILVGTLPTYYGMVLRATYRMAGFRGGTLLAAGVLLLPALTVLGTISPYLVRATLRGEASAGRIVG